MDISKLTLSDKIIAGSGILLFIASFLTWFSASSSVSGGGDLTDLGIDPADFSGSLGSVNGWDVGFLWAGLPALLGLIAAAAVLLPKLSEVKLPELPIPWGQAFLGAGALAALLVILKLLIGEDGGGSETFSGVTVKVDIDRGIGIFLATLASLGLAYGGYLKFAGKEDDGGTATPPPPGAAPF